MLNKINKESREQLESLEMTGKYDHAAHGYNPDEKLYKTNFHLKKDTEEHKHCDDNEDKSQDSEGSEVDMKAMNDHMLEIKDENIIVNK